MVNVRMLRYDEPLAVELTATLKQGDIERLSQLLAADPALASSVVTDAKGGGRSALHLFADWPGHNPNPQAVVRALAAAGADLDTPAIGMWHREAPLHWAASSDDVPLIDALLGAGADMERAGSSINGGSLVQANAAGDRGALGARSYCSLAHRQRRCRAHAR